MKKFLITIHRDVSAEVYLINAERELSKALQAYRKAIKSKAGLSPLALSVLNAATTLRDRTDEVLKDTWDPAG